MNKEELIQFIITGNPNSKKENLEGLSFTALVMIKVQLEIDIEKEKIKSGLSKNIFG